jgi:hypothetical protein
MNENEEKEENSFGRVEAFLLLLLLRGLLLCHGRSSVNLIVSIP